MKEIILFAIFCATLVTCGSEVSVNIEVHAYRLYRVGRMVNYQSEKGQMLTIIKASKETEPRSEVESRVNLFRFPYSQYVKNTQ